MAYVTEKAAKRDVVSEDNCYRYERAIQHANQSIDALRLQVALLVVEAEQGLIPTPEELHNARAELVASHKETRRTSVQPIEPQLEELREAVNQLRCRTPHLGFAPRPIVVWFASLMEAVLRDNDDKGGWGDSYVEDLEEKLDEEYRELKSALKSRSETAISHEAADLANIAMMLADLSIHGDHDCSAPGREEFHKVNEPRSGAPKGEKSDAKKPKRPAGRSPLKKAR